MSLLTYRDGPGAREFVKKEVYKMLKLGVIEKVTTPWASTVVLEPKKEGNNRFLVDYRRLNSIIMRDSYPLSRMEECKDSIGDAKYMFTLD